MQLRNNISKIHAQPRRVQRDQEHKLQAACVRWFRLEYPKYMLMAVPNGGRRDAATGARLKDEGVIAGAPDLILFYVNRNSGALLIEMKTETGRQSEAQKHFQERATCAGYDYAVCRSFEQFKYIVEEYLNRH